MSRSQPKLTAMMPVRNEANRYLSEVLHELEHIVDEIVVLDDASTDQTADVCGSFSKVILHRNPEPQFVTNESVLRAQLWMHTAERKPNWILAVDADEVFEERMQHEVGSLIGQDEFDAVEFRLFDFWGDRTQYRVDGGWNPWVKRVRMLFRFNPQQQYTWPDRALHCGRIPLEARAGLQIYQSDIRVKHYGWVRKEDVDRKFNTYRAIEDSPHLQSVNDAADKVSLEKWIPGKVLPF